MSDLLRVLLVEDNPGDADLIVELLPRDEFTQFEVECVPRLTEALKRVGEDRFDIILLDLGLPDSDGLATLRAMQGQAAELPIIVMTGISDELVALAAIQEDAQDYLVKGQIDKLHLSRSIKYAVERKRAQEELQFRNLVLSTQQEASIDGILVVDENTRILSYNQKFVEMWGIPAKLLDESVDEPILQFVATHLADPKAFLQRVQFLYEHKQKISRDELILKDGRVFDRYSAPMLGTDERYFGRVWYLRDITERKRAEDALKESEEKYRRISQEYHSLLDNVPDGIVQITPDFRVIWANRSITEMVQADETQLKGNCCYQAFWTFKKPCVPCPVAKSFRSGKIEEGNIATPDGKLLELRAVPISDESGKIESVIEVIRNITEHKKLEAQLRQAQKMESIGILAGGIAHDFNNILTAIIGYGYMALLNMGTDDPQRENIEHMLEGADRAAHLTKDLLIFSRVEASEKMPVDLNEIVGIVEKFLARIIGEDIICKIVLHGEPMVVYADMHQLEQVLMNLATNARDAMPEGGDLIICTEQVSLEDDYVAGHGYAKPGRYALLTVSDTGSGMDEETRGKIFEPFFTTKEVGKGTGLGMSVVYGIIKEHDGYIDVYSEPGAGTTFKIYLPFIPSELRGEEIVQEEESLAEGTETILIAEDDESARVLMSLVLKQEGYTVIEAIDGVDAVKKFMENRETIHLLLSDLIMPNMNGKAAYNEMKAWRPDLKAIFASGYAPDDVREKLFIESGVALISKPVLPHVLIKKVRTVLDGDEK